MRYLLVFLGGGLGSCLRFWLGTWLNPAQAGFFWGTWLANVAACLILGGLVGWWQGRQDDGTFWLILIGTGVCGGFSTFYTLSMELVNLVRNHQFLPAFIYGSVSLATGLGAIVGGFALGLRLGQS